MSFNFGTPNTQPGFSFGAAAQPTAGTFTFEGATTGAGDANKPAAAGLPQAAAQAQVKPEGQLFSGNYSSPRFGAPNTTVSGFGTAPSAAPTFGMPASGTTGFASSQAASLPPGTAAPTGGLTFGAPFGASAINSGIRPSAPSTASSVLGATSAPSTISSVFGAPTAPSTMSSVFGTPSAPSTMSSVPGAPSATSTISSVLGAPSAPSTGSSVLGTPNASSVLSFNTGVSTATTGAPASGNLSFGGLKTNTPGISSGTALATTGGGLTNLTFGTSTATPSLGFTTGIGGTPAVTGAASFGIAGATQSVPSSGPPAAINPTPASSAQGGFSLSGTPTQTVQTTGASFNLSGTATTTPAPAAGGFTLGTATSSGTFSLGSVAPTTAAPPFNLGQTTTALSTPGFSLGNTLATAVSTAASTSTPQTTLGTATNVTSSTAATGQPTGLNFCQLEECINKWTLELEEQEKAFVNQATQVNAWDRLLIANGEKIVTLNQEVERVKLEQQQLEQELDYVVGQQRELQDCLVPLEKELASVSATDPEREYTYRLAENLDTQLKQMSEDLKEIIEHLNEANRSQDSSDPIVQIGKILNAHMNSLQWLDQRTAVLQTKIQQIDQMHQNFRQEHERSFSLAYN